MDLLQELMAPAIMIDPNDWCIAWHHRSLLGCCRSCDRRHRDGYDFRCPFTIGVSPTVQECSNLTHMELADAGAKTIGELVPRCMPTPPERVEEITRPETKCPKEPTNMVGSFSKATDKHWREFFQGNRQTFAGVHPHVLGEINMHDIHGNNIASCIVLQHGMKFL